MEKCGSSQPKDVLVMVMGVVDLMLDTCGSEDASGGRFCTIFGCFESFTFAIYLFSFGISEAVNYTHVTPFSGPFLLRILFVDCYRYLLVERRGGAL